MEYTSPGRPSCWSLTIVTPLVLFVISLVVIPAVGQPQDGRHEIRHGKHFPKHPKHRFHEYDYEDATVVLQPEFLNTQSNITVRVGDMATLPCAVRNLGTKEVVWRRIGSKHENMILTVGTFTWSRENDKQVDHALDEGLVSKWNLLIKSVQMSDQGSYECQITDKVPLRTHVHLTVKPRPASKPAVKLTGKEFVDRNEPIRLVCNATGGPKIPEEIDWFKDGTKLDSLNSRDPNIVLTKYMSLENQALISELLIEDTDIDDSGNYICRSSDREIASLKVTVLVADTTNVKRGTGAQVNEEGMKGAAVTLVHASFHTLLLMGVITVVIQALLASS